MLTTARLRHYSTGRSSALQGVLALIVNRYPRVRRVAAEQLYVQLLGLSDEMEQGAGSVEDMEAAIELLADTRWDAELTVVKQERNKLYPLLVGRCRLTRVDPRLTPGFHS